MLPQIRVGVQYYLWDLNEPLATIWYYFCCRCDCYDFFAKTFAMIGTMDVAMIIHQPMNLNMMKTPWGAIFRLRGCSQLSLGQRTFVSFPNKTYLAIRRTLNFLALYIWSFLKGLNFFRPGYWRREKTCHTHASQH